MRADNRPTSAIMPSIVVANRKKNRGILYSSLFLPIILLVLGFAFSESAAQCVTPPSGLVGWWPFNDGTATDVIDGNNGIAHSGTAVAGKVDGALSFSGTAQRVDVPDNSNLRMNNPFTIEGWVQLNTAGTGVDQMIIVKGGQQLDYPFPGGAGCACNYDLWVTPTGKVSFLVRSANGDDASSISTTGVIDGVFHHVAAVFDGNGVLLERSKL